MHRIWARDNSAQKPKPIYEYKYISCNPCREYVPKKCICSFAKKDRDMQWNEPASNPVWVKTSENDKATLHHLLIDTLNADFKSFKKHMKNLEDPSCVSNSWEYLPDLPLWTATQMIVDFSESPGQWLNMGYYSELQDGIKPFIKYWEQYLHAERLGPVDYALYHEFFYCSGVDESDEEVLGWWNEKVARRGKLLRKADRRLYVCASRFDFEGVRRELEAGANMDTKVDGDHFSTFSRIRMELSYLGSCGFFDGSISYESLCDFIGQAAHQKMMDLLLEYDK